MSASPLDFLANFQGGGFRPNRYRVVLTFPANVPAGIAASNKLSFTCKAASMPGSNMGVAEVHYMGRPIKIPGDKTWEDWNITVLLDTDFVTRGVFERWHDLILGFEGNTAAEGFANPSNCFASATVTALDRYDRVANKYQIKGCWPMNVGEISLGYDQMDTVGEFQVTMAVNQWTSDHTPR